MRRLWLYGLGLAALGAAAAVVVNRGPLTVRGVQPEPSVTLRLYGLGTVEARVLSRVGFEVGGALTDLAVDAGDRVVRGQEIARLNAVVQEARLMRARTAVVASAAALAKAERAVERARFVLAQHQANNKRQQELARQNVASAQRAEEAQRDENVARSDVALAEAEVAVVRSQAMDAEAAVKQEEATLSQYRLSAPYDGVAVTRHAEAGAVLKAGDPIFTLIDPATVWILSYVDEERAGEVAVGQRATIRLRSQPHGEFHGSVVRIGLESDRVNEERRVWLGCDDCPAQMYLGEQAEVRIAVGARANALMVPELAISGFDRHRGQVWVVQNGRLGRAELTFGARDDKGRVEVLAGLPEGATIVADPSAAMQDGRPARIEAAP